MVLQKTLRSIALTGIFVLPFVCLIVADGSHFPYNLFFPFITGKNFTFRLIVEIITGSWLALALVEPRFRPRRSWLLGAFALFVVCIAIADALGAYPFKSFWSNYERMDGWVTLAHLLAYLAVAVSILTTEKLWKRFWQVSLGVSVFLGIYGLLQIAGVFALGQGGVAGLEARIDATFGNPIYLAVYMLFHVFIAWLLLVRARADARPNKRLAPTILYGLVIALDTIVLFFTGTRGTMIGLIGGVLITLLLLALAQGSRRIRLLAVAALVGAVVLGAGLRFAKDAPFVQSIIFLNRLSTISLSDSTVKARFLNAGMAWQGVKERPIFGWGQENYAIVFDKYYDPRMYAQEPWFDRVHDVVFDWLVAGGFVGLLSYLSVFVAALYLLWRDAIRKKQGAHAFSISERSILTGLLAGYFFHNLFVFDNITSYILFVSILAYIAWRCAEHDKKPFIVEKRFLPEKSLPFVALAAAIAVWGAAWWVNAGALAQNQTLIRAISQNPEGLAQNLEYFKQAVSYGSLGTQEVREQLAQGATQLASAQNIPQDLRRQFFDTAVNEMKLQHAASPLDARFPLFLGILYSAYGDHANGAAALEQAHQLSPGKQSILFQIAVAQDDRGDHAGALATLKDAFELEQDDVQARLLYASQAIRLGQDALADELLAPVIPSGQALDAGVLGAYVSRNRYDKIVSLLETHLAASAGDSQAYFTLAAAYYSMGNREKAIQALERAKAAIPATSAQADALIQDIRSGKIKLGN
ncbi:MAG: hypothetical protein RLZZ416_557 [Candidatus Parcubacteria bacterium]|jgi:O-antigen ligase/cytochrome c-type biogenesis protein CcmH/NrfG